METITILHEESGERIDKILAQRFTQLKSRTYFQMLIEEGKVLLNGSPIKKREKPKSGDEISVHFILEPEIGLEPEDIPLEIIFEDDHLIVVNKPAGMVVHPAAGNWTGTFVNALLYHCQQLPDTSPLRPGIVHRLDKDTTGLLIAAKTSQAHSRLISLFSSRKIVKEYLAVCVGVPKNETIVAPIGRHPVHRKKMAIVNEGGKEAISTVNPWITNGKLSAVHIEIATGRTHQIRVHMQHRNTPILGDSVYGSTSANQAHKVERPLLHARRLAFEHPITGEMLNLEAPLPDDLQKWVGLLTT